ncbi:site-specific integrase [Sulfitobacter delicatus]|uniref:Phage integrase family protein n=1 Tax=Sulfitobacter delicatus TaxID=218672 RepID=A0A1G7U7H1_9RHOB|nr:site-specific integrase [Sulfitobacter delicatus]SDG43357.1 Phage integrase family protein [Sulfitobacter delicatus]
MAVSQELKNYLNAEGESMRSLSLRAGLGEKAVADIVKNAGCRPRLSTLIKLSDATGLALTNSYAQTKSTFSDLIREATEAGNSGLASKLRWICKNADWAPQTKVVCKQDIIDFFAVNSAGRFNLSSGSYSTYKSVILKALSGDRSSQRKRGIADIGGVYREIHDRVCDSEISYSLRLKGGSFWVYLDGTGIAPDQVSDQTIADYFNHRVDVSASGVDACEKHVKEITDLVGKLAIHPGFASYGFQTVNHPFADGRDKFGVADGEISKLLGEFDERVAPWATGAASRDGKCKIDFLAELDAKETSLAPRKAELRRRQQAKKRKPGQDNRPEREQRDDVLRENGFLTANEMWSLETLRCRRGYVVSLAKALMASTDMTFQSVEELTDPDFLDAAAQALQEATRGQYASGYVGSVLKAVRKLAVGYVARSPVDVEKIDRHIAFYSCHHKGIAPRNKAKLKQFTAKRIQQTIDLAGVALREINRKVDQRRRMHRAEHGVMPKPLDVYDAELVCDVMAVLAHEILLSRAPRSRNVIEAKLDWLVEHDGRIRLIIPAEQVKARSAGDPNLVVPLSAGTSKLMRNYLDHLREKALNDGDERNPYLFPSQKRANRIPGQFYTSILDRVTKLLKRHVDVSIHPHLYRHLIGWIWLKKSIDNLPKVQKLLGHESIQTTLDYYAELDDELVFDEWQKVINDGEAA